MQSRQIFDCLVLAFASPVLCLGLASAVLPRKKCFNYIIDTHTHTNSHPSRRSWVSFSCALHIFCLTPSHPPCPSQTGEEMVVKEEERREVHTKVK